MESLPHELIDNISSNLSLPDLRQTLLVSNKFCAAAEKYSGAFETCALTEHNHGRFLALFSGYRSIFLRHVEFRTSLPALRSDGPTGAPLSLREDRDVLAAQDRVFSSQIRALFATLENPRPEPGTSTRRRFISWCLVPADLQARSFQIAVHMYRRTPFLS